MWPLQLSDREGEFCKKAEVLHNGMLFSKYVQLLSYAYDMNKVGSTKWNDIAAFNAIEGKSTNMVLVVIEGIAKYVYVVD